MFIRHLRPRSYLDAAAAAVAVAVLVGSPGFLDNLELPLIYTTVGMPLALIVWVLLSREPRPWHGPMIVALTLIAIGFKEQGLVLVPLVVAAWWTRAPGATRGICATLAIIAVAYVVFRLRWRASWPLFEQAVGFGFWSLEARAFVATCVVLLACGVLSFNYSRARLGGMAVPFYAISAFFAVRSAAEHLMDATRLRFVVVQGTDPTAPRPTRYPEWVALTIGQP